MDRWYERLTQTSKLREGIKVEGGVTEKLDSSTCQPVIYKSLKYELIAPPPPPPPPYYTIGGGIILAFENSGSMFDQSLSACTFFFFFLKR